MISRPPQPSNYAQGQRIAGYTQALHHHNDAQHSAAGAAGYPSGWPAQQPMVQQHQQMYGVGSVPSPSLQQSSPQPQQPLQQAAQPAMPQPQEHPGDLGPLREALLDAVQAENAAVQRMVSTPEASGSAAS